MSLRKNQLSKEGNVKSKRLELNQNFLVNKSKWNNKGAWTHVSRF